MKDKEFYSTIEAAKLLGVSVRTVQLWVENGSLEAWKTAGGHRRIVAKSVDDYIRANQTSAPDSSNKMRVLVVEDNPSLNFTRPLSSLGSSRLKLSPRMMALRAWSK